jgi:methionyl-tRNA formyltransferase
MTDLRIVFMGTPEFAIPSLNILLDHGYPVVAVVTAPDKPQGRGHQIIPSPVKLTAQQHNIPVLQPSNLKNIEFLATLDSYQANLYVVVAFRMLPKEVWTKPALGTINVHASCLPQYRGAAPINWAIIQGEQITGVTTFFIDEKLDTGYVLLQEQEPIYEVDTAGTLTQRLKYKGANLLLKSIQTLASGEYMPIPQSTLPTGILKAAPKIHTEDCQINWDQSTDAVYNFIRGLSPHPGAWSILNGIQIKILLAYPMALANYTPGSICSDGKNYLYVATQDGAISIEQLQPAGKKPMDIQSFLRGHKLLT